jgi:hypothetical protein
MMEVSNHAKERMKERCGFNKKSCDRMAIKAFEEGLSHKQTKGRLNKWVTSLYFKNKSANNIRLYGDKAYIFCDKVLVTVIQIPIGLMKDLKKMVK